MPRRFPKEFASPAISNASGSRFMRQIRAYDIEILILNLVIGTWLAALGLDARLGNT
jgi:hypothetical protein